MSDELRLKGQEISIRVVQAGNVIETIDSVMNFDDSVDIEVRQDGFLGETTDRFDDVYKGHTGNFEIQVRRASWYRFVEAVIDKTTRRTPDVVFNVVRTDLYPNGDTMVKTYTDVHWGAIPTTVASKDDFVKAKLTFKCSTAPVDINALP